ncbi:hypothetical protein UA08_08183 [Talaromyces atroroseus]|uniref:Uncharacterized protein n=1 Tax=Talaromyces atroroseus TaxID=1441469 RepID=A0A225AC65_TALAT|nr:hypothetical protein UA08_08183 [Talaromyces atroroseus]OKL56433.1 hypothetical protein UA08_08183 [Talaromyces atroroseus]
MPAISHNHLESDYCYACDITDVQLLFIQAQTDKIQDKSKARVLRDIRTFAQDKGVQELDYYFFCARFLKDCEKLLGAENVVPCWDTFKVSKQCKDLVASNFDPSTPKEDSEEEQGFVRRVFRSIGLY